MTSLKGRARREVAERHEVFFPRTTRKLAVDESTLMDKVCPTCKTHNLIYRWDWNLKKYVDPRCSNLKCKYGN